MTMKDAPQFAADLHSDVLLLTWNRPQFSMQDSATCKRELGAHHDDAQLPRHHLPRILKDDRAMSTPSCSHFRRQHRCANSYLLAFRQVALPSQHAHISKDNTIQCSASGMLSFFSASLFPLTVLFSSFVGLRLSTTSLPPPHPPL